MKSRIPLLGFVVSLGIVSFLPFPFDPAQLARQSPSKTQVLPTVQQVMDRYVGALGGRNAIFKHKSMTIHIKLEVPDKGLKLDRVAYFADRKNLEEIVLPQGRRYQSGYDGTIAWEIDPDTGPALVEGDEAKSRARDADMYYPARILDYFSSMEVVDVAQFEGRTCYHLKGTTNWGRTNEHFYDTTTGLLAGYRFNSTWRGGAGDESAVFTDYKDFGGWLMPARIEHKQPARTLTEVVDSVTFDDVAASTFNLPDAVKALLKRHQ